MTYASDVKAWMICRQFSDTLNITIRIGDNFEIFGYNEKLLGYMDTVAEVRSFLLGYERALSKAEFDAAQNPKATQ